MSRSRPALAVATASLAVFAAAAPVAASPSCTAQFVTEAARAAHPLGQNIVVVEVRTLTLGGRNLGDEVSTLLATADRSNCPVTFE